MALYWKVVSWFAWTSCALGTSYDEPRHWHCMKLMSRQVLSFIYINVRNLCVWLFSCALRRLWIVGVNKIINIKSVFVNPFFCVSFYWLLTISSWLCTFYKYWYQQTPGEGLVGSGWYSFDYVTHLCYSDWFIHSTTTKAYQSCLKFWDLSNCWLGMMTHVCPMVFMVIHRLGEEMFYSLLQLCFVSWKENDVCLYHQVRRQNTVSVFTYCKYA